MKWSLTVETEPKLSWKPVEHSEQLLSMGSCFSQYMGDKMKTCGMRIINNPFGILYNPGSIEGALHRLISGKAYTSEDLFRSNDVYASLDHHSDFSGIDADKVLEQMNASLKDGSDAIRQASNILVTLGTSFYYEHRETQQVVANCHKLPSTAFERRMVSVEEIVSGFKTLMETIRAFNPRLQWLFTVSPVRHWKDGAADNQWSKARLICAVRALETQFDYAHYFPAYEIMMDELRDHRFYNPDLIHPSDQAVELIWERFSKTHLSDQAREINTSVRKIRARQEHRPLNPQSEQHRQFILETDRLIREMESRYDYLKLSQRD